MTRILLQLEQRANRVDLEAQFARMADKGETRQVGGAVETAIARVAERVRQGGHHIEEAVIRRRFAAGRRNLEKAYKPAVDSWAEYDNVGEEPTLLQWGENR